MRAPFNSCESDIHKINQDMRQIFRFLYLEARSKGTGVLERNICRCKFISAKSEVLESFF